MKNLFLAALVFLAFAEAFGQKEGTSFREAILQHREAYKQEFLADERSPLQAGDLANLRFFEPDENYRVAFSFRLTPDEKPFELPTYSGRTKPFRKYGVLSFEINGQPCQLAVYQNLGLRNMPQYAQHLFLPFRDLTNDETTYGGGRYIDLTVQEVEAENPVLDFNKCYNPWCHYSDGYNCPVPPTENSLEVAIKAGEMKWAGEKKHK
ncbi:MAG: DUF1684 domain-containing protein [Lewinellaceae bacterium]|nr:DUF1684 domain-containing protein [Saprospiraceae bacterium]MCB9339091.1 DUF1684 domain-containing protein [Lewinellaceae bacterium]